MQRLEVSCAVRPLYGSLGVKGLIIYSRTSSVVLLQFKIRVFRKLILLPSSRILTPTLLSPLKQSLYRPGQALVVPGVRGSRNPLDAINLHLRSGAQCRLTFQCRLSCILWCGTVRWSCRRRYCTDVYASVESGGRVGRCSRQVGPLHGCCVLHTCLYGCSLTSGMEVCHCQAQISIRKATSFEIIAFSLQGSKI